MQIQSKSHLHRTSGQTSPFHQIDCLTEKGMHLVRFKRLFLVNEVFVQILM